MNAYMEIIDPIGIGTIALKTLIDSCICQKGNVIPLPAASRGLRDRPPGKSKPLEPGHPLLGSSQRSVDQQANRGAQSDRGATINSGRLSGSRGVTSFLKVTAVGCQEWSARQHRQRKVYFYPYFALRVLSKHVFDGGIAVFASCF